MRINSDSPFFIPAFIVFIAFFALMYKCTYSESNINRIEPILKNDPEILAKFGHITDYKIYKSTVLFNDHKTKNTYIYHLKLYGEKDKGKVILNVDENQESADYPYTVQID